MFCGWKHGLSWGEKLSENGSVKQSSFLTARVTHVLTVNIHILIFLIFFTSETFCVCVCAPEPDIRACFDLDNNNCAPSFLRSLCEIRGDCFGPRYFSEGAQLPKKNTEVQDNHRQIHTMTEKYMVQSNCH